MIFVDIGLISMILRLNVTEKKNDLYIYSWQPIHQ